MFYGSHGLHGRVERPERLPHDPRGRALRHRALRVRHARHPARARAAPRHRRPHLALAALRDRGDHDRLHEAWWSRRGARPAWRPTARPGRRTPRAWPSRSRRTSRTRPGCRTSTCCTCRRRKALEAAMLMAGTFPHVDFRREVTIGHLLADVSTADGIGGKVNPPLRPREDVEALWAPRARRQRRLGRLATTRAARRRRSSATTPRRHLRGQVGLRRHRVPAARAGQRGPQARAAAIGRWPR